MVSLEFIVTSTIAVMLPGTGVIYTIATGLFQGKKASIFAAFGCTMGIIPPMLASIFGLAAVMHTSALAFQVIKFAGVAYLLYMAWSMWNSGPLVTPDEEKANNSLIKIAVRGCLINILNPKLSIFFLAFLPQFISIETNSPIFAMAWHGLVFMALTFVFFVLYGLLANAVRDYVIRSEKISSSLQKLFAGSFAALGLKLALSDRT